MSTLAATQKNLDWFMDRLYETKRRLEAHDVKNPTFVILTKGKEDRHRVERHIYDWFKAKYGLDLMFKKVEPEESSDFLASFYLPEIQARVVLMDV